MHVFQDFLELYMASNETGMRIFQTFYEVTNELLYGDNSGAFAVAPSWTIGDVSKDWSNSEMGKLAIQPIRLDHLKELNAQVCN